MTKSRCGFGYSKGGIVHDRRIGKAAEIPRCHKASLPGLFEVPTRRWIDFYIYNRKLKSCCIEAVCMIRFGIIAWMIKSSGWIS